MIITIDIAGYVQVFCWTLHTPKGFFEQICYACVVTCEVTVIIRRPTYAPTYVKSKLKPLVFLHTQDDPYKIT